MPTYIMKNTTTNTIKIAKQFTSLKEAVLASDISLEYNEGLALQDIQRTEQDEEFGVAYLTEDGEVYYTYHCDIRLLNKYEPFHGCIHNGDFSFVRITGDLIEWVYGVTAPKTRAGRKMIANIPAENVFAIS